LGKPVVGITSLAAMARRAEQLLKPGEASYPMVIAVDARRDMIYLQRFEDVSGGAGDPVLSTAAEVAIDVLRTPNGPLLAVGSGGKAFAEAMRIAGYECDAKFPDLQPDALSIAELAPKLKPLERVVPLYLRQPDVRVRETLSLLGTRK
jgi:tRNA A37 threonylcarbamoyladenosine modification protein TsaB